MPANEMFAILRWLKAQKDYDEYRAIRLVFWQWAILSWVKAIQKNKDIF